MRAFKGLYLVVLLSFVQLSWILELRFLDVLDLLDLMILLTNSWIIVDLEEARNIKGIL